MKKKKINMKTTVTTVNKFSKKLHPAMGLAVPVMLPLFIPALRSRGAKKVLNLYEGRRSLFHDEQMKVTIPGGKSTAKQDWAPGMMTYNADRKFSKFIKEDIRLTILYNFGAFPIYKRHSSFYDPTSPYYTSFYGGYGIRRKDGKSYGVGEHGVEIGEMIQLIKFDLNRMVLRNMGKKKPHFRYAIGDINKVRLFNEPGWYRIDGVIETNGAYHRHRENPRSLVQYGKPPKNKTRSEEYPVIELKGRTYVKYDSDHNLTLAFFCLSRAPHVIDAWEEEILKKTVIKKYP